SAAVDRDRRRIHGGGLFRHQRSLRGRLARVGPSTEVTRGLVPRVPIDGAPCPRNRDGRDTSAFTRVHSPSKTGVNALKDALCPAMTAESDSISGAMTCKA